MPTELYSRELKSEPQTVKTVQRLTELVMANARFRATYHNLIVTEDGTAFKQSEFTVERTEDVAGKEANDAVAALYAIIEVWRGEDEAQRASDLAKELAAVDPVSGAALPLGP